MLYIDPALVDKLKTLMRTPVGSFGFHAVETDAFTTSAPVGVLLQVTAGAHLFRIERSSNRQLCFLHSSPGTGTRVATISLDGLPEFDGAFLCFTWSPTEINFYFGPKMEGGELLSATGMVSPRDFRVGEDGSVFEIGDNGIEVMGAYVHVSGKPVLRPTAIDTWKETNSAIEILWTGIPDQVFIHEVVLTNITLSILLTGFEAYSKTRFVELEKEGIQPNTQKLFDAFSSRANRADGGYEILKENAIKSHRSLLGLVLGSRVINFQNYDHLKRAYRTAYGLKLGEIGIDSTVLEELQTLIKYRHLVVHVSPLLGCLNLSEVPPAKPIISTKELCDKAISCYSQVVSNLHDETLRLKSTN